MKVRIFITVLIAAMAISTAQAQSGSKNNPASLLREEVKQQQRDQFRQSQQKTLPVWQEAQKHKPQQPIRQAANSSRLAAKQQPATKNSTATQSSEKQKTPLLLDVSSIQPKSGKVHKENSSFTYIPITSFPFMDSNSLTAQSQMLQTLQNGNYAVGYSMTLNQGDIVDISLCGYTSENNFDAYLFLLDANYNEVSYNDDGLSSCNLGSRIEYIAPASGTYYIIATSYSSGRTGDFTLNVSVATAPQKTYYVDAVNGDNTNDGQTPSTPLASLPAAMDSLNAEISMGTLYIMSDIVLENTLTVNYFATILPYGNTTYTIFRDTVNNHYNLMAVYGSLSLGEENMQGQLIFDGGYDTVNNTHTFIAYESILNIYEGTVNMYNGITLQNNNTAGNLGAAVYLYRGSLNFYGGKITRNHASSAAGIYNNNGSVYMEGGEISYNFAQDVGGGIYNEYAAFTLNDGSINNNTAHDAAGIYNYNGYVRMEGGEISYNIAESYGGGVCNEDGEFTLNGGSINNNTADHGGGMYNYYSEFLFNDGDVSNNTIYLDNGIITLGANYANTQTKDVDVYPYYRGRPVLEGNLSTVASFQLQHPDWHIDAQGKLAFTGTPVQYYVDSLNGDDNNDGSLSTPFKTPERAVETINNAGEIGVVYIMSDLLLSNTLYILSDITLLPYGNTTYTVFRDTVNNHYNLMEVYSSLSLGEENMQGQLIFDGGYDTINNTRTFIAAGSILNIYKGTVNMYNGITLQNNNTTGNLGAAVHLEEGSLNLYGGKITRNHAGYAAGIYNYNSYVRMEGGEISYNIAESYGGGILNDDGEFTLNGGSINNNTAHDVAGGIYNYNSYVRMEGGEISYNFAQDVGGGVYNDDGEFTLNDGSINNNTARDAAGIYNSNSYVHMEGGEISYNIAESYGGGVCNEDGEFTLNGGAIENNTAISGGGIFHYSGDMLLGGNISLAGNDIATVEDGHISVVTIKSDITTPQAIALTPTTYNGGSYLPNYTPCREMVRQDSGYTFKGEDLNLFTLTGVRDTVLAFAADNQSINIYQAPDAANDTTVTSCGTYTLNGMAYTGNGTGYEYVSGSQCDSLVRKVFISILPVMEEQIGQISGQASVTAAGSQTYSVESIAGATYQWSCSNSNWSVSGSGASITLSIRSTGTGTLSVQVAGDCDTARRNITINASFTDVTDYNANDAIRLYPNPTTGKVYLTVEGDIRVYSIQGALLHKTYGNEVDLSGYAKGVYFIRLNGKTMKVVKR